MVSASEYIYSGSPTVIKPSVFLHVNGSHANHKNTLHDKSIVRTHGAGECDLTKSQVSMNLFGSECSCNGNTSTKDKLLFTSNEDVFISNPLRTQSAACKSIVYMASFVSMLFTFLRHRFQMPRRRCSSCHQDVFFFLKERKAYKDDRKR